MTINEEQLNTINGLVKLRGDYINYIKGYDLTQDNTVLKQAPWGNGMLDANHSKDMEKEFSSWNADFHRKIFQLMDKYIKEIEGSLKELGYNCGKSFGAEKYMTARIMKGDLKGSVQISSNTTMDEQIKKMLLESQLQPSPSFGSVSNNWGGGIGTSTSAVSSSLTNLQVKIPDTYSWLDPDKTA